MGLLDRIKPANERARVIVLAAENGMGDDDAKAFAETFRSFDEAKAELDRRAAQAKPKAASPKEIVTMVSRMKLPAPLAEELIAEEATMEAATARVQSAWAAAGDGHEYGGRPAGREASPTDRRAALTDRVGLWLKGEDPRGGKALTPAMLAQEVCRMQGLKPWDASEAVTMAMHSTSDFPAILDGAMGNDVARRIEVRMPDVARLSHEIARADFRDGKLLTLSASGEPQPVAENGEIRHVSIKEGGEALPTPEVNAAMFSASMQMLVNDASAAGLFNDIANRMAEGAVERFGKVLHAPLDANSGAGDTLADGNPVFHSSRGNLDASPAAISATSLAKAFIGMRTQKGLNGELLQIEPRYILVHPKREAEAAMSVASITPATADNVNPFAGRLDVVVDARLSDPDAWFVVADPARFDGLAHAFLDGQRRPTIESREGWNRLGMEWRLVWPLGARFVSPYSWFKNEGA